MKYKYLTLALLPILALTLTACTVQDVLGKLPVIGPMLFPSQSSAIDLTKEATLNVWGLWENPEAIKTLIDSYQSKYPNIKINYDDRSVLNLNQYKQAVFNRIVDAQSADIIRVHQSWTSRLKDNLAPMPDSLMSLDTYNSNFYPIASKTQVFDAKIYGVPTYYDGLVLVYNKNHFKEVGQVDPPIAWEEFRRLAAQLTIRSGDGFVRAGAALGTGNNIDMFSDILGLMFAQAGVTIPQDLTSKPAQDAVQFYTNFATQDRVWSAEMPEASSAFSQGRVSMIFVPSWKLLSILSNLGDVDFEVGVAPVPQARPDNPVSWGSFWTYVVPKASPNSDVAWHFINYLAEQEQQLALFNESSKFRQFGTPYSLVTLGSQLSNNPYLKPIIDTAPYAVGGEIADKSGNDKQTNALKDALNEILSGLPVDKVLEKTKETLSN